MRLVLSSAFVLCLSALSLTGTAHAQSVTDELPGMAEPAAPALATIKPAKTLAAPAVTPAIAPTEPYAVSDVQADVKADTAAHARDQALTQAERAAFVQLCARLNLGDAALKLNDDALAAMVQSFEVQSEHVSAVRYIGVFTIRFKPSAVRRRLGNAAGLPDAGGTPGAAAPAKAAPALPTSHLPATVMTDSLAAWAQIKRRLGNVPQITRIDTVSLGRSTSHIDLIYTGAVEDLENAVTTQGFILRQDSGGAWQLSDNSMVPR